LAPRRPNNLSIISYNNTTGVILDLESAIQGPPDEGDVQGPYQYLRPEIVALMDRQYEEPCDKRADILALGLSYLDMCEGACLLWSGLPPYDPENKRGMVDPWRYRSLQRRIEISKVKDKNDLGQFPPVD
jgi:hypothetical protein